MIQKVHPTGVTPKMNFRSGVNVLAADDKNVRNASVDTCLTPRHPSLNGREACSHCMLDKVELVKRLTVRRIRSSKTGSAELSADGEQRKRCVSRDALKETRSRICAS